MSSEKGSTLNKVAFPECESIPLSLITIFSIFFFFHFFFSGNLRYFKTRCKKKKKKKKKKKSTIIFGEKNKKIILLALNIGSAKRPTVLVLKFEEPYSEA